MKEVLPVIALVSHSFRFAMDWMRAELPDADIRSASGEAICQTEGGPIILRVITEEDRCRGAQFTAVKVIGTPEDSLVEMAKTRIRL